MKNYRKDLEEEIILEGEKIKVDDLLCLMTEDSNSGAWCWVTSEKVKNNEWPLVYYLNHKLYYKVENFTEWIEILVETNSEVIKDLDTNEKLGLG